LFGETDFRKNMPRFAPETYATNCKLLIPFTKIAHEAGCTPAQLAIAWLLHKAPHILPIPGTTSVEHALENAAAVNKGLTPETLAACEALINSQTVQGNRYPTQARSEVDTEEIAA
jgi:aryl-alcohol dehydrogenase-like predicted oxidoreductase